MSETEYVTVNQVVAATGATEMTVYNWRHGVTRSKLHSIKKKSGARHRVLIPKAKFLAWADKEGVKVDLRKLKAAT